MRHCVDCAHYGGSNGYCRRPVEDPVTGSIEPLGGRFVHRGAPYMFAQYQRSDPPTDGKCGPSATYWLAVCVDSVGKLGEALK